MVPEHRTLPLSTDSNSASTDSNHRIVSKPIQDIRVGMRVPAHNPQLSDEDRAKNKTEVDPNTWRKFSLELEKENGGGKLEVTLLRPASWLVDEIDKTEQLLLAGIEQEIAGQLSPNRNASSAIDGLLNMVDTLGYSLSGNELVDSCSGLVGQMDRSLFGNWSDPMAIAKQFKKHGGKLEDHVAKALDGMRSILEQGKRFW